MEAWEVAQEGDGEFVISNVRSVPFVSLVFGLDMCNKFQMEIEEMS